jgi:putative NADH-flavin reductase
MKIALFGATGRTGKEILIQSLIKGYRVKALVRDPQKIDLHDEKLELIQGDVRNEEAVFKTIEGADAVMFALGMRSAADKFVTSQGTGLILKAMEANQVKRIVVVSAAGLFGAKDSGFFFGCIIRPLFLKKSFDDKVRQLELLENSEVEWILVRPVALIDAMKTGKYHITLDKPIGSRISRADVADFMLNQLNGSKYIRQMPIISY